MDFKTLLPDFGAIGSTDWSKPKFNTNNPLNLVVALGVILMIVFLFLPWCKVSAPEGDDVTRMGITTWYGIFACVMTVVAIVGVLYDYPALVLCASVLGLIFGLVGVLTVPSMTSNGETLTGEEIKEMIEDMRKLKRYDLYDGPIPVISHLGAILYMVASGVTAVAAYLKIAKK